MWDHGTGRSKGYGFVSFRIKEDAEVAINEMQGKQVGSRHVRVGWAQHKQASGRLRGPPHHFRATGALPALLQVLGFRAPVGAPSCTSVG